MTPSHLFKEGLGFTQNVFEFCQLQKALHKSFIICIAVFHFIFKLLKLGLKNKNKSSENKIPPTETHKCYSFLSTLKGMAKVI